MSKPIKILFINPRKFLYSYPMLGVGFLSAYLKKYGNYKYQIKLADQNINENIYKIIDDFKPDIAGITATTPQIISASRAAEYIKVKKPDTLVITGGPHPTALPAQTLQEFKSIDIVTVGESEQTFREIVDSYAGGGTNFRRDLHKINGIAFRDDGKVCVTAQRELIAALDDIPIPDRDIFSKAYYFNRPRQVIRGFSKRSTHMMSSRGCPYDCTYCSSKLTWRRKIRFHSPERVLEEIDELVNKFHFEAIFFEDDLFIADKNRAIKICNAMINRGYKSRLIWAVQMKSNLITDKDIDLLKLMKEAGCVQIEFGFESASERFLKIIKKNTASVQQNQQALDLVKKAGIRAFGNFIFGFQGETADDLRLSKDFIVKNYKKMDYFQAFIATPYPGTEFWNDCVTGGVINEIDWDKFNMGITDTDVFSNTLDKKQVRETVNDLTLLAFKKISVKDKLLWLITRFQDDPRYVVSMIFKNIMRQLSFLTHSS